MIFSASRLARERPGAGRRLTLEMSSTSVMSRPAIGFGTDGVIATSLGVARTRRHRHGRRGRVVGLLARGACRAGVVGPGRRAHPRSWVGRRRGVGDVPGGVSGRPVARAAEHLRDPDDEQQGDAERPSAGVPSRRGPAARPRVVPACGHANQRDRPSVLPRPSEDVPIRRSRLARPPRAAKRACSRALYDRAVSDLHAPLLEWYDAHARDLPWRRPTATPWGVLVSEFMLQQTPVARVLPVYDAWLARWPRPADLAAEPVGRGDPGLGSARLPAPRDPAARRGHRDPRTSTRARCRTTYEALRSLPGRR